MEIFKNKIVSVEKLFIENGIYLCIFLDKFTNLCSSCTIQNYLYIEQ